jgi:hypothetical protein
MTFLSELKKPFNLVSTVIAVFSILLSIYLYFQSLQKREPYYLQHSSSQIYKKSVVSPKITVIDDVGKPVVGDIHVVELSFWNNGKTPIEPSDVRTPIVLEFPDGYRLLDSKVVKENKPAVTRFKISDIPPSETAAPRVRLDWAHLDPGLGARLQFIYVGEARPKLKFNGDILDAEILDGSGVLTNDTPIWIGIPVVLIILLFSGFVLPGFFGRYIPNRSNWITVTLGFTSLIVSNAIGLFLIALLLGPKIVPI